MDGDQAKVCSECGELKPLDAFNRRGPADPRLYGQCKLCRRAATYASIERRKGRPIQPRAVYTTHKTCGRCQQLLPLESFPPRSDAASGIRSVCLSCKREAATEYREAHREKLRQRAASYREAHAAELSERQRVWRLEHPNDYRAIHSKWKSGNKDSVNAATHRRRSTLNGAGSFTAAEWAALKAQYDHRCLACKRQEPEIRLTVDHVKPLSRGGLNTIANIQPLCKSCNSAKYRNELDLR